MSPINALIADLEKQISDLASRILDRGVGADKYLELRTQYQTLKAVRETAVELRDHRRVDEDELED